MGALRKRRIRYEVRWLQRDKTWGIYRDGKYQKSDWEKRTAVSIAAGRARAEWQHEKQPTQLLIRRKDGRFERRGERTYGNDPYPPRG